MVFNTTRQVSILAGYGVGGLTLTAASPRIALGINALSFAVNVLLVYSIPRTHSSSPEGAATQSTASLLKAGGTALWRDPMVRIAVLVVNVGAFSGLAAESMVVVYSTHLGHPSGLATGLLAMVMPITAIISAAFWPSTGRQEYLLLVAIYATLGFASLAALIFLLDPGLPLAVLPFLSFGVLEIITVPAGVVVISRLPQATRGSSMGFLNGSLNVMQLLGAATAGALAAATDIGLALAVCSLPAVAISVVTLGILRALPAAARADFNATQPA